MRATTISSFLAALVVAGLASSAAAQDYCVTCTGPDAKYHCVVGGDASISARTSRGQMLCITQLAQSGGHASCSVSRTTTEPCEGQVKTVMFPASEPGTQPVTETLPPVTPEALPPGAPPPLTQGTPPPAAPQQAPSTVGEIAEKTAKDTGSAIGQAASKAWKCLSSFFGDC
jgi:hypothetical protein